MSHNQQRNAQRSDDYKTRRVGDDEDEDGYWESNLCLRAKVSANDLDGIHRLAGVRTDDWR